MHPTLPSVYLTFWLLFRLQIALLSQTCWLIFTPSNYCLPISTSQPPAYCFSLIVFDHFSSLGVSAAWGWEGDPTTKLLYYRMMRWGLRLGDRRDGGMERVKHSWVAVGSAKWNYKKRPSFCFIGWHRDWARVWLMFTCISETCESCFIAESSWVLLRSSDLDLELELDDVT